MSVETDPLVGTDLAGYRIESVLGRGGMGVVYLATDLRLKRRVALKLVAPELAADARFRERFLREAELAASLDHSHIVPVHAAGETDGQLWIAMRYVQGTDLRSLLDEQGPLEPARALGLIAQVASALDAAHAVGLVHRDVKPANVLVTEEGEAEHCYLADFGLARTADLEIGPASGAHLSGTVDYTAPEQIAAEPADQRADVYSLGCVLYECLAGEPPFRRPRAVATLFAHASEPPPSLRERRPELPEGIDAVVARALAKDPGERYQTCGELCDAARKALGLAQARLSRRRLLLLAWAIGLAVAAAAAVPAILLTRGGQVPEPLLPLMGDSIVRIDPQTLELTGATPVDSYPTSVVAADGSIWVVSSDERTLSRIDPATGEVLERVPLENDDPPTSVTAGDGAIWITQGDTLVSSSIWRYDPATHAFSQLNTETALPACYALRVHQGAIWAAVYGASGNEVWHVLPQTGQVADRIKLPSSACLSRFTGADERSVWFGLQYSTSFQLLRIDVGSEPGRAAETIELDFVPKDIALYEGSIWATSPSDDSIKRIDLETRQLAETVTVGRLPFAVEVGGGFLWTANTRDHTVTRIDPETLDVRTIEVGGTPTDITADEGAVWVAVDVR
jgi:tRNA A-37 threonylcarbamoyl transferase component Bud32